MNYLTRIQNKHHKDTQWSQESNAWRKCGYQQRENILKESQKF